MRCPICGMTMNTDKAKSPALQPCTYDGWVTYVCPNEKYEFTKGAMSRNELTPKTPAAKHEPSFNVELLKHKEVGTFADESTREAFAWKTTSIYLHNEKLDFLTKIFHSKEDRPCMYYNFMDMGMAFVADVYKWFWFNSVNGNTIENSSMLSDLVYAYVIDHNVKMNSSRSALEIILSIKH